VQALHELHQTEDLRDQVEQLSLVTEAIWGLLKDRGLTDQQLRRRVDELDLSDGRSDGRHTVRSQCPNCAAMATGGKCQICGSLTMAEPPIFFG
jgi:hypothetical protein